MTRRTVSQGVPSETHLLDHARSKLRVEGSPSPTNRK
jgi:hypothetical protein